VNCHEIRALMDGYGDGELDLVRTTEMEQHFETCPACWRDWQNHQALRAALGARTLYHRAPESLQRRIRKTLQKEKRTSYAFLPPWPPLRSSGVAVASLAVAAFLAGSLFHPLSLLPQHHASDELVQEVVSSHVRSLIGDHLMDVASTDRHTVKPWFNGKLDFAPPVEDLTDRGFPLIGGRLDAIGGRPVAALVYRHRKHVINLLIWPSPTGTTSLQEGTKRGFHTTTWSQADMTYWAISDMGAAELHEFAQEVQRRTVAL
jgi:anti-sigma factor RsiW